MSLAYIERLPTELIQPIFLASGPNLALPLVSHRIAAKLCDERIYESVCTQLLATSAPQDAAHSRNQTMLFAAKWMTWDFFKAFILKTYTDSGCLCGKTKGQGCPAPQWPPNFEDATTMDFHRAHWPTLTYVKARLPLKLLQGPWTQNKIQFLRFLLWTTAMSVRWADTEVMEVVRKGKRQAILEKNLEVVQLFNHNRRLGRAPGLEQIRFTVMEAGCDRSIVYDTMANALSHREGNNWVCAELDNWCQERIDANDPKGQWLKTKLEELRHVSTEKIGEGDDGPKEKVVYGVLHPSTGDYDDEHGTWVLCGVVATVDDYVSADQPELYWR